MSRKDYVLIAKAINDELANVREHHIDPSMGEVTLLSLTHRLAAQLKYDNVAFDSSRFITACGF